VYLLLDGGRGGGGVSKRGLGRAVLALTMGCVNF